MGSDVPFPFRGIIPPLVDADETTSSNFSTDPRMQIL